MKNDSSGASQENPTLDGQRVGELELLIVGDLNAMPHGHEVKRLARFARNKSDAVENPVVRPRAVQSVALRAPPTNNSSRHRNSSGLVATEERGVAIKESGHSRQT